MKEVKLNKGMFALVDDEDFDKVKDKNWRLHKSRGCFYAVTDLPRSMKKKGVLGMHKAIMPHKHGFQIDHIDRNGLNNQKSNLRYGSHSDNCKNRINTGGTSVFRGVCFIKGKNKWQASITVEGKNKWLGYFNTEKEAAISYNNAAIATGNPFYPINKFS